MGEHEPKEMPISLLATIGLSQQVTVKGYKDSPKVRGAIHQRRVIQFGGSILGSGHNIDASQTQPERNGARDMLVEEKLQCHQSVRPRAKRA